MRSTVKVLVLLLSTSASACACSHGGQPPFAANATNPANPSNTNTQTRYQFVQGAKAILPAVVSVSVTSTGTSYDEEVYIGPFGLYSRGFSDEPIDLPSSSSDGSGVIVDTAGYILTNNHLVEGALSLKVVLANGHEYPAKMVGSDLHTDLAVVKIDADRENLQAAVLGDSDNMQIGEWVIAAGSPFGRQTISVGVISAVGRGHVGVSEIEDFIQTDIAMNPGSSGGPLTDVAGRVIGISTTIASPSGAGSGIGFAVPIALAKAVMEQLIKRGNVVRGYAGVLASDLTTELAQAAGFKGEAGALVEDLAPGGPAELAGLRVGDIIVQHNGQPIRRAASLRNAIAELPPGTEVRLEIWRAGQALDLTVRVQATPRAEREHQHEPNGDARP